jgi:hypothetical protein
MDFYIFMPLRRVVRWNLGINGMFHHLAVETSLPAFRKERKRRILDQAVTLHVTNWYSDPNLNGATWATKTEPLEPVLPVSVTVLNKYETKPRFRFRFLKFPSKTERN